VCRITIPKATTWGINKLHNKEQKDIDSEHQKPRLFIHRYGRNVIETGHMSIIVEDESSNFNITSLELVYLGELFGLRLRSPNQMCMKNKSGRKQILV
jgi:hypothetical protein